MGDTPIPGHMDIPEDLVKKATEYALFQSGVVISQRQMKRVLGFITPDIIRWSVRPPIRFAKGYKGGVDRGPRDRSTKPKVVHVAACCEDGKCGCRCHS